MKCKPLFVSVILLASLTLGACSTNPATGKSQFTALMSPQQEVQVGASEHENVIKEFGLYNDPALQSYVNAVGQRVTQDTERADVQYRFFVIDSPIVNAFALPGGYIYVSRGLLALANSEAELAAVLAHETGHITARHSAERYSHGVVTSLGAAVLSAALDSGGATQALGLGSNLYLSSYSRGQENEADTLGLRYMTRGGYDPAAMSSFLASLQAQTALESKLEGSENESAFSYFSTHPATAERVSKTLSEAQAYPQGGTLNHDQHLTAVKGMVYGDSAKHGFVRGQSFLHTEMGFGFEMPDGFKIVNQPEQVIGLNEASGSAVIFDMAGSRSTDPLSYMQNEWMKGQQIPGAEPIMINGMKAATASFAGKINNQPTTIRIVAIQWSGNSVARFQIAIPKNASSALLEGLKRTTYSFRRLSAEEKASIRPERIDLVTAKSGDNISTLAARQSVREMKEDQFRVLNGLKPGQSVEIGRTYKIITGG